MTKAERYRWEARAAAAVAGFASVAPLSVVRAFGRGLGRLLSDLDPRHVAVATANLRQAFPHWDEVHRLRAARAVYAHFGQVLLEILWLRGRSREEVLRLVEVVGREHVEAATAGCSAPSAWSRVPSTTPTCTGGSARCARWAATPSSTSATRWPRSCAA